MAPTRPRAEVHIQVGFLLGRVVSPPRDYGAASEQGALLGKPCPHGAARSRAHPSQGASWARAPVSGQQANILTRQARPPRPLPRVLGQVPLPESQREPSDSHLPRLSMKAQPSRTLDVTDPSEDTLRHATGDRSFSEAGRVTLWSLRSPSPVGSEHPADTREKGLE